MSARKGAFTAAIALGAFVLTGAAACDGELPSARSDEPLRVRKGQFIAGDLPGAPPGTAPEAAPPNVTTLDLAGFVVTPGEAGRTLGGRVGKDAVSVGIRFADLGTGYWIVPVGGPDQVVPTDNDWSLGVDFNLDAPPGIHPLRVVAFDAEGHAGAQIEANLCLTSPIPDNLHACSEKRLPPDVVFTLQWDADADVDLHVVTPEGRDVNPKNPLVTPVDAGVQPPASAAKIDRDSLLACVPDGRRQEDLIFPTRPTGVWDVYANLYDACGKASVRFDFRVFEADGEGANRHLVQTFEKSGTLLAIDANGDARSGLFVLEVPF